MLIVSQSGGDYKGGRMKAFKGASSRVRCQWTACGTKLVHIVNSDCASTVGELWRDMTGNKCKRASF